MAVSLWSVQRPGGQREAGGSAGKSGWLPAGGIRASSGGDGKITSLVAGTIQEVRILTEIVEAAARQSAAVLEA